MLSVHRQASEGYPQAGFAGFPCTDLQAVSGFVTQRVWSPIIWVGGTRNEAFFCCAHWCALDFDDSVTKDEARKALAGLRFFLAPTKSDGKDKVSSTGKSKPACDRFRVVLPFAQTIWNVDVFRYNMRRAIARFGSDPLPYDAGRVWQPSTHIESISASGEALDVVTDCPLEETQRFRQEQLKALTKARARVWPDVVKRFSAGQIAESERNDMLFKAACFFFEIGWTVEEVRALVRDTPAMEGHDKTESTIKSAARRTGAAYF